MTIYPLFLFGLLCLTSCIKDPLSKGEALRRKIIHIAEKRNLPTLAVDVHSEKIDMTIEFKKEEKSILYNDRYGVASHTKLLAALLILKNVEEEKIKLDDRVSQFIQHPELNKIEWFNSITVNDLLNHSSGIPDYTRNPQWINLVIAGNPPWTVEEKIGLIVADEDSSFKSFNYSNTNYVLLERLVEVVHGKSAIEVFNSFYADLQLPGISFQPDHQPQSFFAPQAGQVTDNTLWVENYGFDGGAYASASDLSQLLKMVFVEQRVLNTKSLARLQAWMEMGAYMLNFDHGSINQYGLGIMKYTAANCQLVGHPGSSLKYQSFAFADPSTGAYVVLLTNCSGQFYNEVFFNEILSEIIKAL